MRAPLLLLILAGLWPVPAAWADDHGHAALPDAITVTDDTGRSVQLAAPARRIVTLSPHATELVFAAGAGDRLVAVAPYSDYPPQATQLPTIGGLGGLDRERLLALAPDLVVAWDSGNRPADLAWLTDAGIALYRSEPQALDDIATNLIALGRLAGSNAQAGQAAARYRQALADACPQPANPPLAAFIQLAAQPLLSVGGGHWLNQAIARAGLRNIYAEQPGHAMVVGEESLRAASPAVLLYLAYPGAAPLALPGRPLAIGLDPALWARPGPRLPAGIAALCRALPHSP
jgi:iron complex transport system substrate-binding protein